VSRRTAPGEQFSERLTFSRTRVLMTSSRETEIAIEVPVLGHGLFTYCLLAGLNGGAARSSDGIVTLMALYQHIEREVTTRSRALGGNQHPMVIGELEGDPPLLRLRP
jgi:uncharacterized caspase-like protein